MPRKVIGKEMTQEDLTAMRQRIETDFKAEMVTVSLIAATREWWCVESTCYTTVGGDRKWHATSQQYITPRGPHLVTVMWKSLMQLYTKLDREEAGLPPLIGT